MSNQKLIIGYYRLSMEDDSEGESNSIINQRKLVKDYISNIPELASMPFQEFYDDGYSGSSMERPAIKQVLDLAIQHGMAVVGTADVEQQLLIWTALDDVVYRPGPHGGEDDVVCLMGGKEDHLQFRALF